MAHVMSDHASVFEIEQQDVAQQGPRDVAQRRRCHAWQFVTRISNFFMETITGLMDYIIKEVQDVTITKVIKWVCSILMIFGGVVPFIPQYREIKRKGDAEGFSTYVCLVLIFANTLRILFWFGKRFELPLLIQSFVMNFVMLLMIHLCVTVRQKNQLIRGPDHTFTGGVIDDYLLPVHRNWFGMDFDIRYFWQWTDFQSYLDFVFILTAVCSLLTFLLMRFPMFIESLGFIALFTEAMLAVPQLIQNFRLQSTEGMSVLMILMWMVGDVFKTLYFVLREAPAQFWVCGGLQVFIDVVILYQVHLYKDHLSGLPSHAGRTD